MSVYCIKQSYIACEIFDKNAMCGTSCSGCEFCVFTNNVVDDKCNDHHDPTDYGNMTLVEDEIDPHLGKLKIKKLYPWAKIPRYMVEGDSGMDLFACSSTNPDKDQHSWLVNPFETTMVSIGISIAIPKGYEGQIRARSGLSIKKGLGLTNSVATIDNGYRGPLIVPIYNQYAKHQVIKAGERIAQLVIAPVKIVEIVEVDELDKTQRGSGGFGHTGK